MSCWYSGTIDANGGAPEVRITIAPAVGVTRLDSEAAVTAKGAVDRNVADNTVTLATDLANFKLNGGGLGCQAAPAGSLPAVGVGFFGTLLGLLGRRRRRR